VGGRHDGQASVFRLPTIRGLLVAIALPAAVASASFAIAAALGVVSLRGSVIDNPVLVVVNLAVFSVLFLGEEIGWRGYLLPRLATVMSGRRAAILTGAVHAAFHLPLLLLTTYQSAGSRLVIVPMVMITITAAGASYTWLTWSTGSIGTVSTMHAAVNESMQRWSAAVAATSPAALAYTTTETGYVTALLMVLLAGYLLTRRAAVFRTGAQESRALFGHPPRRAHDEGRRSGASGGEIGRLVLGLCTAAVPRGKSPRQRPRAPHLDRRAQGVAPLDLPEVPTGERHGVVDHDDQLFLAARVLLADLGVAAFDQQPATTAGPRQRGVVETNQHPTSRQAVTIQAEGHPSPQDDARMGVFGRQLRPFRPPVLQSEHDLRQFTTRCRGLVERTRTIGLGTDLDHPGALQFPQPFREQTTGKARCAVGDLVEGAATEQDVAQDDDGPALGQQVGCPSDRTVLPVGAHADSVPPVDDRNEFRF
jgi:membrane protease YdiL (CAAX protease family)